jgi:hypothetical protein
MQPQLEALWQSGALPVAAAAGEILAFHGALRASATDLRRFFEHDDPAVHCRAWRLAAHLGAAAVPAVLTAALRGDDAGVKHAALVAAAWCRDPTLLALCREAARQPSPATIDALHMLAVLGGPADLPTIDAIGRGAGLGPARFRVLGAYGHPSMVDVLVRESANPDPATAAAAGAAFAKITGCDVESTRRATVAPPAGAPPDEFAAEFQDEVTLPDPDKARREWEHARPRFAQAARVCRGFDLTGSLARETFAALDLESRWEILLRARHGGAWSGSPFSVEVFPQRQA